MEESLDQYRNEVEDLNEREIQNRIQIFENNIRIMNNEENQIKHEIY